MLHNTEGLVSQMVRRAEIARQEQIANGQSGLCSVITFSRLMGSGAKVIAKKVADDLGWAFWGREILDVMANNADVSREVVEALDEKSASEVDLLVREILGDRTAPTFYYHAHLAKAIGQVAKLGNAVILGRGADVILPDALHIRVEASLGHRVRNMMEFEGMAESDAVRKLQASDRERESFLTHVYDKTQVRDFRQDVVIHMDRLATVEAAEIVKSALQARWAAQRKLTQASGARK